MKLLAPTWGLCTGLLTIVAVFSPVVAMLLVLSLCLCMRLYHQPFNDPLTHPAILTTIFAALLSFIILGSYHTLCSISQNHLPSLIQPIIIPILVDSIGYLVGSLTHPSPLNWSISPKKTKIGYLGSILGTFAIVMTLNDMSWKTNFIVLGLIIFSIVGDLGFSLPKRLAKIKDYSQTLPGHGGLLDRLDSIFATLFFMQIIDSFPLSSFLFHEIL